MSHRVRFVHLGVAVALGLGACGTDATPISTDLDAAAVRFTALQEDLLAVNRAQAATVGDLRGALEAIATIDTLVPDMVDEEQIDDALQVVPAARIALDQVTTDGVRQRLVDVALAVDEARLSLRRTEDVFDSPTDLAYLEATDEVLTTLRDLSAAQDALAQVVERHLPVYRAWIELAEDFKERRRRFRSSREAADAFSVEARSLMKDIAVAQEDIGRFLDERDVAALAVSESQRRADAAFESRGDES